MSKIILKDLLADIHTLNKELALFEDRYGLLSETFYEWYAQGHEPEDDAQIMDLAEWAGLYQSRQQLVAQYRKLLKRQLAVDARTVSRQIQLSTQASAT